MYIHIYIYIYICVCVCVCVYMCNVWNRQHDVRGTNGAVSSGALCAPRCCCVWAQSLLRSWRGATHCNTLQYTATHCNTLQHSATHCNALQHTAKHCNTLQCTATHCNTLQHAATHCNTLQRSAVQHTHIRRCVFHSSSDTHVFCLPPLYCVLHNKLYSHLTKFGMNSYDFTKSCNVLFLLRGGYD